MSKRNPIPFSTAELLNRAQTEIICALLRLIPWERRTVRIGKMFRFLNRNSSLEDGYMVEAVTLTDDGHHLEATIREIDYEQPDACPKKETKTFPLVTKENDIDNLALLKLIYDAAEKELAKPEHRITDFYLMPAARREGITDSLLLESGETVFSATVDGKWKVRLYSCGDVRIVWKGESYRNRASFPDELVEAIRQKRLQDTPDAFVDMNNWYEITVYGPDGSVLHSDLYDVDIDTMTEDDARGYILDTLRLVLDE